MDVKELESSIWRVVPSQPDHERRLCDELGVSRILATALVARGISDPNDADLFLNPSLDHLHDPSLLPDYRLAVDAILDARDQKKKIYVRHMRVLQTNSSF